MTAPLLSLASASLTLSGNAGPVEVLRDISLEVTQGESLALVGPSGSGKSSLLMLMGGLEQATSGSVAVAGHDLTTADEDSLARIRAETLGVVFQSFHLIPTMTALENVALPLELSGQPGPAARAAEALAAVGLADRSAHYPAQMSGGEQQRVALARATAPRPRLILADEPTGSLDTDTGRAVADLLFDLRAANGATLILVTHSRSLAARCDRILELRGGRLQPQSSAA